MKIGIFAKTFARTSVEAVFDAVQAHGLSAVQFNLACAGLPSLPDEIDPALAGEIRRAAEKRGIEIAAVSGTFNMIHPDPQVRQAGLRRLRVLAAACRELGTRIITLCTGTRDPEDMWRWHPENASPEAWADLLEGMEEALKTAEQAQVTLAFEPEHGNVVHSAVRGRALLDALHSPYLKVVIDPANLIDPGGGAGTGHVLDEAFDLLGGGIVLAHAKDRAPGGVVCPAGQGMVDFPRYVRLLRDCGYSGPLVLHGLAEADVNGAAGYLSGILQEM